MRTRRAASAVAATAFMALLALAALAINESNERTELVYRSSLDSEMNPAAGSGKVSSRGQQQRAAANGTGALRTDKMRPCADVNSTGQGGWATGDPEVSWGPGSLDETYYGENSDQPGIPCESSSHSDCLFAENLCFACQQTGSPRSDLVPF